MVPLPPATRQLPNASITAFRLRKYLTLALARLDAALGLLSDLIQPFLEDTIAQWRWVPLTLSISRFETPTSWRMLLVAQKKSGYSCDALQPLFG